VTISRQAFIAWIAALADLIAANQAYLTELDAAIGDADHGANMHRGMQAVLARLPSAAEGDIGALCKLVGMTLVSTVGGASGPLYGTFFLQLATATAGKSALSLADWVAALDAGIKGVIMRGKAQPGDKTMIDALLPALQALREADGEGATLAEALRRSADAAAAGRDATVPLVARKGRASYLGERSAGHQDPGATSAHLLLQAASDAWGQG
jgi:dihydroxyacetone kinase-like protein